MSFRKKSLAAVMAAATTLSLAACAGGDDENVIKIGATDPEQKQWEAFKEEVKNLDFPVEVVAFSDYNTPNQALIDGSIDVNNFQHMLFLAQQNTGSGSDLVPIGATQIYTLGIYYKDHDDLKSVEEAGEVAIPNDVTNQGRAINVLAQAGLLTLKEEGILVPDPADIDESKSKVKVVPVDAAQTATSYLDGTPAVINNTFLTRAGIDPKSVIFHDDPNSPESKPYINGFVTTQERKDDPKLQELVELWHSEPVQKGLQEETNGTAVPVRMSGPELNEVLKDTEKKMTEQK
ncbi:MAG TPA: methionine ABC transporter substrate-binding protein [Candidatus Corynebacterium gallistercoris]|uniref:Methionine ABC transporter substrate-binding protein n=1 Tax=Candidatus Corynebacterium gallistercoris TaxID=2838530 RepID=A0A9D1RYU2_9CORY|nr:methionine ABC transporter substrate-binding protein [Candidatus Corynebacterium gallistercoris]